MTNKRKSEKKAECLRILHLSDFHFRLDRKWDQDPVLAGLAESIEAFIKDGLEPDVVVFTGDIAFSGKKKEYDEASTWIDEKLLPALPTGFDDSRLYFVPGNHDVDRTTVKRSVRAFQKELLNERSQDAIAQTLSDPDERSPLLKRHTAFLKFAKRFGPVDKQKNVPWWSTTLPVGDKNVHFCGLCSSWMSCGEEDHGRLLIGKWQINKLFKKSPETDVIVVLVHHPWSYLPDFDRSEIESQVHRQAHIVLRGHLHEQRSRVSADPDNACLELAAGSVYDGSDHSNAFQLIELVPGEMLARVHYRLWRNKEWIVDRNAYKTTPEGVAEFSLQAPTVNDSKKRHSTKKKRPVVPEDYCKWLQEKCADIELLGLKVKQGQAVCLNHIYVPLTTIPPPEEHQQENKKVDLVQEKDKQPTLLLNQLNESSLYVPGAPGAGKSTFCRWVAYLVSYGKMPGLEISPPKGYAESFPNALHDRFPLLVRLRDFWDCLPTKAGCRNMVRVELEKALANWIDKKQFTGISGSDLSSHLEHGSVLLILDGVDEVPLSHGSERNPSSPREMLLSGLIDAIPYWHRRGNRLLLTSRPYGLNEDTQRRLHLRNSPISTLSTELQNLLVHRWFHTLLDNPERASSTSADMMKHIGERVGMDDLANNPMLLTAMCIIYGEGKRLPQDTYDLYGRIIDNVLYNRFPHDPVVIEKVRNRLAVVAYGMHTGYALDENRMTPQAAANYDEIDRILRRFQTESPETEPGSQHTLETREQLLSETGLLLPQGNQQAGFYHLSIQEFLAAQWILNLGNTTEQLFDVFRNRAIVVEWRKTLSLLFACLVAKFTPKHGITLLSRLVEDISKESLTENDVNKAVAAADCVEILLGRGIEIQEELRKKIRTICIAAEKNQAPLDSLWTLGVCLGRVSDPRIVVDLREAQKTSAFIAITANRYNVQFQKEPIIIKKPYLISQYPVTNSQFEMFIKDHGYKDRKWWSEEGWKWKQQFGKKHPAYWDSNIWAVPNHPVVGVTWYEGEAFAKWAGGRLPTNQELIVILETKPTKGIAAIMAPDRNWPVAVSANKKYTIRVLNNVKYYTIEWTRAEEDETTKKTGIGYIITKGNAIEVLIIPRKKINETKQYMTFRIASTGVIGSDQMQ